MSAAGTFSGKNLSHLILPLVLEQLLAILVGLCDTMMVSHVGEAAVTAVSLVDTVNVLLVDAFIALATGGAAVAGQYLGRGEDENARHTAGQLLRFLCECSLVLTAGFYLGRHWIIDRMFSITDPTVSRYAALYFNIVEASIPFVAVYSTGIALLHIMGDTRVSLGISFFMNVINILGNAVLIFGLRLGVAGAAVPTLLSRIFAAGAVLAVLANPGRPLCIRGLPRRRDYEVLRYILHFGVPNGVETSMFQMGKILLLSTISAMGTASVAAYTIAHTICTFQFVPGEALGYAMVTVVAQAVGSGDESVTRSYVRRLMRWSYGYTAASVALILLGLPLILSLYEISPQAEHWVRQILLANAFAGTLIWPAAFTLPQALRAAGDTRFVMAVSSISMWTLRIGLGMLMGRLGFGVVMVFCVMFADWALRAVCFWLRFRGRRWLTANVVR